MKRLLFASLCSAALVLCGLITNAQDALPADLVKDGQVLLLLKQKGLLGGKQNKGVARIMKKRYKGAFELVTREQVANDPKYANTDVYRYFLIRDKRDPKCGGYTNTKVTSGPSNAANGMTIGYTDQYFVDRKTNTELPRLGLPAPAYEVAIRDLLTRLNM